MELFGWTITRRKAAVPAAPVSPRGDGWYPTIIREPYTGAWQKNDDLRPDTLLNNPAVFRCISLITTDIGKTPLLLKRFDTDGIGTEIRSPAFSPVLRKPNRFQTIQQFKEAWMHSRLVWGNTYVYKQKDDRNVVRALYVLNPARVMPLVAPDGGVYYEIRRDDLAGIADQANDRAIVPASALIHDRWNCLFHPLIGVSPLYACGGAALQGLAIQDNSTAFFSNGSQPSGIVLIPKEHKKEDIDLLATTWEATHGGSNRGKTGFLTGGATYETVTQTAQDSQLTEQLRWSAQTVAEAFGVPINMVDASQQPPYANGEASLRQYHAQCLQTHMEAMQNCLDEGLELPADYGTEFDTDALFWMDTATQTKAAADAIGSGAMSPNEARRRYFNLGPVPGGDSPYMQQQYFSLEALAQRDAGDPFAPAAPARAVPAADANPADEVPA